MPAFKMSFKRLLRICFKESVSLGVDPIVSTFSICMLLLTALLPVVVESTSRAMSRQNANFSNITLLDLYPELKGYLLTKALAQLSTSSTTPKSKSAISKEDSYSPYYTTNGGGGDYANSNYYNNYYNAPSSTKDKWAQDYTNYGNNGVTLTGSGSSMTAPVVVAAPYGYGHGHWGSKDTQDDSDTESSHFQKEVLKHWHPFGSPEFYDSWKFKPQSSNHHHGWSSIFPFWDNEEDDPHEVSHDLSKDVSCLAGLLGLKTLKKLKFATIYKKLKLLVMGAVAFKLGVLLSPVAIPLLFPIIILVTFVKILPLILIIVLLLKILKKQVKIKKPFGKFLDDTGSLFFDDVDYVTTTVLNSTTDECVDKISCGITNKSTPRLKKTDDDTNNRRRRRKKGRTNDKMLNLPQLKSITDV